MSFPNNPNKYQSEAVIQPADMVALQKRSDSSPVEALIICLKNDLPHKLRWKIPVQKMAKTLGDLYLIKGTRGRLGVLCNFGIGAPAAVALAEEMIALGAKKILVLSWGGALQKDLRCGDIVLNDRAIRDEGVSHHYLQTDKYVSADRALKQKLEDRFDLNKIKFVSGSTWTTDAPYRETWAEVLQYQSEGVQVVEMEIAGLFALGVVRKIPVASMVVVADSLAELEWKPPIDMQVIDHSFEIAYKTAVQVLSEEL